MYMNINTLFVELWCILENITRAHQWHMKLIGHNFERHTPVPINSGRQSKLAVASLFTIANPRSTSRKFT